MLAFLIEEKNGQESRVESGEGTSEGKPVEVSFKEGMSRVKAMLFSYSLDPGIPSDCRRRSFVLKTRERGEDDAHTNETCCRAEKWGVHRGIPRLQCLLQEQQAILQWR